MIKGCAWKIIVHQKELYTAIAKTILMLVTYKLPLQSWKKSDRLSKSL